MVYARDPRTDADGPFRPDEEIILLGGIRGKISNEQFDEDFDNFWLTPHVEEGLRYSFCEGDVCQRSYFTRTFWEVESAILVWDVALNCIADHAELQRRVVPHTFQQKVDWNREILGFALVEDLKECLVGFLVKGDILIYTHFLS